MNTAELIEYLYKTVERQQEEIGFLMQENDNNNQALEIILEKIDPNLLKVYKECNKEIREKR